MNSKVKVTKIDESIKPNFKSADWAEYIPGTGGVAGKSIPLDYSLEGELIYAIGVGNSFFINRTKRNGVAAPGLFSKQPRC